MLSILCAALLMDPTAVSACHPLSLSWFQRQVLPSNQRSLRRVEAKYKHNVDGAGVEGSPWLQLLIPLFPAHLIEMQNSVETSEDTHMVIVIL